MNASSPTTTQVASTATSEWQARVDLAAAHRLADVYGWTQLIYNHFTCRVPGEPSHFLVKPHTWMFREVTASSLVKLDLEGRPADPAGPVNAAGFAIHTAVLKARPDVNAVLHIHTDSGIAISAHKDGLRFMSQAAMRFYGRLGYHDYYGIAEIEESESIARDIGSAKAMILRNHGLLVVGRSIPEAMSRLNYLMSAIESQLKIEATGAHNILLPPPDMCERAARQWVVLEDSGRLDEWPAMLRWMDGLDAGYRA